MPTSTAPPVFVPNEIPTAGVAPEQVPGFVCLGSMVSYTDIDGGTGQGVVLKMVADDPTREGGVSGWLLEIQPDGGTGTVMVMPSEAVLVGEDVAVVPTEVSVKKRTVARGRGTATFPRGAPIRGEGGRFGGSEPGEGSDDAGGSGGGLGGGDRLDGVLRPEGDYDRLSAEQMAVVGSYQQFPAGNTSGQIPREIADKYVLDDIEQQLAYEAEEGDVAQFVADYVADNDLAGPMSDAGYDPASADDLESFLADQWASATQEVSELRDSVMEPAETDLTVFTSAKSLGYHYDTQTGEWYSNPQGTMENRPREGATEEEALAGAQVAATGGVRASAAGTTFTGDPTPAVVSASEQQGRVQERAAGELVNPDGTVVRNATFSNMESASLPVQVTVPAGTPVFNAGQATVKSGTITPESPNLTETTTGRVLMGSGTGITVTGMSYDPDSGLPFLTAVAGPRE